MKSGPPTLKAVATAAGVHISTASRALDPSRRHLIGADVLRRVEDTAKRIGYRKDFVAAALRTGRSRLIGVLVPDVANPVFGPILSGVDEALGAQGYSAVVANAAGSRDRALRAAEQFIARKVEGLVAATAECDDPLVSLCLAERIPLVLVNRAESRDRVPTVISDDEAGMRLAVDHLVALGHRNIGHIAGPQNVSTGLWRLQGFVTAMRAHGLDPDRVGFAAAYARAAGEVTAAALLQAHDVTAIACSNDLLALGAYGVLRARGLRCPEDVSIVGYNDMPLVDLVDPPLTTIRINSHALGLAAGRNVLASIAGHSSLPGKMQIAPTLVIRQSTAALVC